MTEFPFLFWFAIVIAAVVVIVVARSKASAQRSPKPRPVARASAGRELVNSNSPPHHWASIGEFAFSVVGESHYQDALKKIAGDHGKAKARVECIARLMPDDANKFDDKAVAVLVGAAQVGNLSREDARRFRRRLGQKGLGSQITSCDAVVLGGGEWRGEPRMYGMQLDLKPFD
ncbi:hypothetical protein QTH89_05165 [Variovorax sp. J22G21]|uniref:hypothetical protein n=1 Tax=Variovorax fucosicus TaxID=3053517 RepID=UPI0025788063|nr:MULTISPECIES: hypothetical protein [unclassified Variovorax]MDM0041535.1 hypothetical protein [Variovorax sp. J22R193]MDM0060591.1 hypothetical protein [Variovorax sp. J22G21]